ncbi:endonuclease VIII [Balneola sp. MJW-20]|uniref:endonuclease VIII n=1 Tax=Gracilimonas aurantiaca TaxID=3234185 RepID=UPI0034656C2D
MPEGPEIWRAADKIKRAISGHTVKDVWFDYDHLNKRSNDIKGREVTDVLPRGKAIITKFSGDLNMYSHNQLYGKWMISKSHEEPDNNRTLRVRIKTENATAYLYSASEIELLKDDEVEKHSYICKLGPDVVHPATTFEQVLARYQDETFKNRKLTTLLLDPGFLSGIGNYLRSEILFLARVDPSYRPTDCSKDELQQLAKYSLDLPRRSYETGGLTTTDDLVKALKEEGATRSQYRHYVYGRASKPCYLCGNKIQVVKTGGRKVFYCEYEQIKD